MWWNLPGISDGEDGEDEDVLPALADGNLGHEMQGEERAEGEIWRKDVAKKT